ncbi:hypothetical protein N7530_005457 [Penicillium desertorum]|uniref:Uncharacterized protein n=1 Tax=Penicillium desertorum TaxID=1303715 RepID=A0A9X0BRI4_9EURO|nr:hypothetical protein N7530_005457 [Penicillium desertorum]
MASTSGFGETAWLVDLSLRIIRQPKRLLRPADLDSPLELRRETTGNKVLLAGFLIALSRSAQHVQDAYICWANPTHHRQPEVWPLDLAGLRVFFHVTRDGLTQHQSCPVWASARIQTENTMPVDRASDAATDI